MRLLFGGVVGVILQGGETEGLIVEIIGLIIQIIFSLCAQLPFDPCGGLPV